MENRLKKLYTTKAHYEIGLLPEQRESLKREKKELLVEDDTLRTALDLCVFHKCLEKDIYGEKGIKVYREGNCGNLGKRIVRIMQALNHQGNTFYTLDHIVTQIKDRILDKDFFVEINGIVNPVPHLQSNPCPGDDIAFSDVTYIDSVCGNYIRDNHDPLNGWKIYYGHNTRGQWPAHRHPNAPVGAMEDPHFYEERIQKFVSYLVGTYFPEWQHCFRKTQGEKRKVELSSDAKIKKLEIMNEFTPSFYLNGNYGKLEI